MRTLAIGDVHGCLTALDLMLELVEPAREDRLVFLGDYVDRGPNSCGVIDRILELRKKYDVICLIGNHEIMMRSAQHDYLMYESWLRYGGKEALASYPHDIGDDEPLERVPQRHWQFLDEVCLPYFEDDSHIFVHGNVLPNLPLAKQEEEILYWDKFTNRGPHVSGKRVICGHTSQKSGWPLDVGHSVVIDTWVYGEGWLTCLDVNKGHFWQTNQAKGQRLGTLA